MAGFDVTEVNDTGKIVKIIGFFGELKPRTASILGAGPRTTQSEHPRLDGDMVPS